MTGTTLTLIHTLILNLVHTEKVYRVSDRHKTKDSKSKDSNTTGTFVQKKNTTGTIF